MTYVRLLFCLAFSALLLLSTGCSSQRFVSESDARAAADSPELRRRVSLRMQLAIEYYQAGQLQSALEEVRQVLLAAPNTANAYSLRALIQMDLNDVEHAEQNFQYAMKLEPRNSDITNNYGWFLCQTNRERESVALFEKVMADRMYATPEKAMINAGVCSLRLKDIKNAERYFMMGYQIQPGNPSINANLAKIFFDRAQFEKARFYIQRVIKDEIFAADVLWLAIKIDSKLGDQSSVANLGTQLRRRHPNSKEYALFQKGAFNE
ncbi:type IV pilus biogenesis/stability protein PilW [Undibacterium sp. LX40W]|uniref:Type IV pilus biogenesis/stability protein PilW n=1 Tax=Undibacterium nitidum TaxID=2762298 RepID=A0A923HKU2_9BURK|nr:MULTISPECIES: type IV pilus biogenesis/stability protein PilW [Undibacterium]MBC3880198.1 type IV pilus biogenesis/stability protein PilW [Undibacterium nitidum]MBC3891066.1 type IV pilus biogenesis/stability protein PilW [Undibacterium sp. LX40W]